MTAFRFSRRKAAASIAILRLCRVGRDRAASGGIVPRWAGIVPRRAGSCRPDRVRNLAPGYNRAVRFLGVDFGWQKNPSGLALLEQDGPMLRLLKLECLTDPDEIVAWVDANA